MNKKKQNAEKSADQAPDIETAAIPPQEPEEQEIPESVTLTREQALELRKQIETLQAERDDYLNTAQRVQADFDNYRKRNAKIREDAHEEGVREAVKLFLPVLDNLDRACAALEGDTTPLSEGVRLVLKQFGDALQKIGVNEIEALNCPFDPERHDAVAQAPCENGEDPGSIQEVFLKGYTHNDRVLRASMVKVAQHT